ncbi:MAG: hypothetical protein PUA62_07970 [Lachnospiraceae bacterium]|nr:hypothetical protein [Lachnospiraceae bacterium]
MRRKIYCKYANDRNANLKIRTTICEESDGTRIVCKEGLNSFAKQHIQNMYTIGQKIQACCQDSRFELNKGKLVNGVLELEYLTGDTLEQCLDSCLAKRDYDAFKTLVGEYCDEVRKLATDQFEPTKLYYEVFGQDAVTDSKHRSMKQSDIDIIFGNVIMQDDRMVLLDYEWVFEFPIPVDYILYRTKMYYENTRHQELRGHVDMCELFRLEPAECEKYAGMERTFQKYITRSNAPLWELYETIGKEIMFPIDACNKQQGSNRVEIVRYRGEEFESTRQAVCTESNGKKIVRVEIDNGVSAVRVDPCDYGCMLYIDKVFWNDNEANVINYGTNGDSSDNKFIGFRHDDPQIMIGDLDKIEGLETITIMYYVDTIEHGLAEQYKEFTDRYNQERYESVQRVVMIQDMQQRIVSQQSQVTNQYHEIESKNISIIGLQAEIDRLHQEINRLHNSASWKITKPLRFIMRKIRRRHEA